MNDGIRKLACAVATVAGFAAADLALAHHSFAMFDSAREIVMKGTVARWAYHRPHVALYIENEAG